MPPDSGANGYSYGSIPKQLLEPVENTNNVDTTIVLKTLELIRIKKKRSKSQKIFLATIFTCVVAVIIAAFVRAHPIRREKPLPIIPGVPEPDYIPEKSKDVLPFSTISPTEIGFPLADRPMESSPGHVFGKYLSDDENVKKASLPTNSWHLNLLSRRAGKYATDANRAYTIPYIVDTVGPITGLRMHWPYMRATSTNIQMVYDAQNALTIGTMDTSIDSNYILDEDDTEISPLGISLKWSESEGHKTMISPIVRGMPYGTMIYAGGLKPSIASGTEPASRLLIDGTNELECDSIVGSYVEREIQIHFKNSDFTWVVFFSHPVKVKCTVAKPAGPGIIVKNKFQLDVVDDDDNVDDDDIDGSIQQLPPLVIRAALVNECTTGRSNIPKHCDDIPEKSDVESFVQLLRDHVDVFPKTPSINIDLPSSPSNDDESVEEAVFEFNWDARLTTTNLDTSNNKAANMLASRKEEHSVLIYGLPHHREILQKKGRDGSSDTIVTEHCTTTFHGKTCIMKGNTWYLVEDMGKPQSFTAPRPPEPSAIPYLAKSISNDLALNIQDNLGRGAIDTYFSGKMLAKFGRIILIADELVGIAKDREDAIMRQYDEVNQEQYAQTVEACKDVNLPTEKEIMDAVEKLKCSVQVWLNGTAEAPFLYDPMWGGVVNCGCDYDGYDEYGKCRNKYPDCPALMDVNTNFGNGYYNDHHFHYGYHIYAASVVAKFDEEWGRKFFNRVLLLIRDIANPSVEDEYFRRFRQKDWFLGNSWASGIISANTPHGRNQESSSEAIAAYEAVALYGAVMTKAFEENKESNEYEVSQRIKAVGQLLTATELRAADRYWHVYDSPPNHSMPYPSLYTQPVVGMLYQTQASFQTWFAPQSFVSYGIQFMPFTPIAELRDNPLSWISKVYTLYKESCESDFEFCENQGWVIMLYALQATLGEREEAIQNVLKIPPNVFISEGGSGQSLTNTIWFLSTRPDIEVSNKTASSNLTTVTTTMDDSVVSPELDVYNSVR